MTPSDLEPLEKLSNLLNEVIRIDPTMTVGELNVFVSVAAGHAELTGVTPGEIRAKGISGSAVTRSIQYWGKRFHVDIDDKDRRLRRIRLTDEGKHLAKALSRALS